MEAVAGRRKPAVRKLQVKGAWWQHLLWPALPVVMIGGWFYPLLGFGVLACMLGPSLLAPFRGRWWCGNACPRGLFSDLVLRRLVPGRPAATWLRGIPFRLGVMAVLMGVLGSQLILAWGHASAMGLAFVRILTVTTVVGVVLAAFTHERAWCLFCPMGTLARAFVKKTAYPLDSAGSCRSCNLCVRACPMQLSPPQVASQADPDCLKCGRCTQACPVGDLTLGK